VKLYAILLSVLYLSRLAENGLILLHAPYALQAAIKLAEIVIFALCLAAAVGLGWGKRWRTPGFWGASGTASLMLGAASVMVFGFGGLFGLPQPERQNILQLGLMYLPYVLFAVPAVLYDRELRGEKNGEPREGPAAGENH
jgi:hypothetical protein